MTRLTIPLGVNWQLVIVDNNSTDETKQTIDSFSDKLPIQYVFEQRQGHSISRNAAIRNSEGDLILWTDNDVLVPANWLEAYANAADRHPQSAFFGGKILPTFESPRPVWLESTWEKCRPVFAYRDLGDEDFDLEPNQFPYGANFAIRTAIQKQFTYDLGTGRNAGNLLGGDEITMLRRVAQAGHVGRWVGNVGVEHIVPPDRATEGYVANYFVGQGQSNVQNGRPKYRSRWQAFRVSKFNWLCYLLKRRIRPADEWVSHMIRSAIATGEQMQMQREQP